jgi:hypothetical protein
MLVSYSRPDVRDGQNLTDSFRMALNGIIQGVDIELDDTTWTMIASFEDALYVGVKLRLGHCSWGGKSGGPFRSYSYRFCGGLSDRN